MAFRMNATTFGTPSINVSTFACERIKLRPPSSRYMVRVAQDGRKFRGQLEPSKATSEDVKLEAKHDSRYC